MSLQSYKKVIEAQKERDSKLELVSEDTHVNKPEPTPHIVYIEKQVKRRGSVTPLVTISIFLAILLVVAAIKNPSQTESNSLVKSYIVENINDFVVEKMTEDTEHSPIAKGFGRLLINVFAPSFVDAMVHVNASNYIFFLPILLK